MLLDWGKFQKLGGVSRKIIVVTIRGRNVDGFSRYFTQITGGFELIFSRSQIKKSKRESFVVSPTGVVVDQENLYFSAVTTGQGGDPGAITFGGQKKTAKLI